MKNLNDEEKARKLEEWINEKKIINEDKNVEIENIQSTENREQMKDAIQSEKKDSFKGTSYIKMMRRVLEKNSLVGKRKMFFFLSIIIFTLIITLGCVLLPQVYKSVLYDIDTEKVIEDAKSKIEMEEFEEGIELLSNVLKDSRYYNMAQEQMADARKKYEKYTINKAQELIAQKRYSDAYILVDGVEKYLGETELLMQKKEAVISSIKENISPEISVEYDKEKLVEGEMIDTSSLYMKLSYAGCYGETVTPDNCIPAIIEKGGENSFHLTWNDGQLYYDWNINALPKVVSIEAEYKGKELTRGDKINKDDILVIGVCSDNSTRKLYDFSIEKDVTQIYGNQKMEVKFGEIVCQCDIFIHPKESAISAKAKQTFFQTGTTVNKEEIYVTLQYEDGSERELSPDEFQLEDEKLSKEIGEKNLKVSYNGFVSDIPIVAYQKVELYSLKQFGDSPGAQWIEDGESLEDMFGNTYSKCLDMHLYGDYGEGGMKEREIVYYLGGKYRGLEGVISNQDIGSSINEPSYIAVYSDDNLVYMSPLISKNTQPFNFTADLSGAEYLHIKIMTDNNNYYSKALVSNLYLSQIKK